MHTATAGPVIARRWLLLPFVVFLVLLQVVFLVKPAEALDTKAPNRPGSWAGKSTYGAGVASRGALRFVPYVGIGLLAYEGYKFYLDMTELDISGEITGGLHPASDVAWLGDVSTYIMGEVGGKYQGQVTALVENAWPSEQTFWAFPEWNTTDMWGEPHICGAVINLGNLGAGEIATLSGVGLFEPNMCRPGGWTPTQGYNSVRNVHVWSKDVGAAGWSYLSGNLQTNLLWTHPDAEDEASPAYYTVTTQIDCYDPATGTTSTHTVDQEVFVTDEGAFPSSPLECPAGKVMSGTTITAAPSPGTTGPTRDLYTWQADEGLTVPAPHPFADCLDGSCELRVERVIDLDATPQRWEPCSWQAENCSAWWWETDKQDLYRCMWGDYVLELGECTELAYFYHPSYPNTVTRNPSLQPPATPQEVPLLRDGTSTTWTPPSTPPVPTTGTPPTGTPDDPITITPPTVTTPGTDDGCLATGLVAWNPVTWVYAPVKCALEWAFVPSAATIGLITSTGDTFMGKAPFSFWGDASGWLAPLQGGGSQCLLIEGTVVGHPLTVVDSCTPGPVEAHIMSWRPWLLIVVHAWVMVPLMWWAWKAYMPGSQGVA